uniref:Fibronectin type-III domain-containing protein n=1 Tax=Anabas testudineus TaxID=64144 RepID=A0A3Q1JY65_ANATE
MDQTTTQPRCRLTLASHKCACPTRLNAASLLSTSPCQPQGIKGNLDCVTNSVFVLWDATPGADSYTVTAVDGEDYLTNCTTSTNTTCEVKGLACGALYNFSVTAKNMQCESQPSAPAVPCMEPDVTSITPSL